ncbi:MAG: sigma-70 family RNA polymerase sigma factor [Ruminococcus sp.]|nr:sigma-70 family RNA polymerase sigma factor [Ruminococcus sp.]
MNEDFDEIYRLYADGVYRYILSLCRDETLAEDILQNTMLKAIDNIGSFSGDCSVKTWLCTIARNDYFNHLKKADNKNVPLNENVVRESADPEAKALSNMSAVEILKLVHKLDEPFREIFMLRFYGELIFSEIGEVFGKSENWARVSFFRAREKLAQLLEEEEFI